MTSSPVMTPSPSKSAPLGISSRPERTPSASTPTAAITPRSSMKATDSIDHPRSEVMSSSSGTGWTGGVWVDEGAPTWARKAREADGRAMTVKCSSRGSTCGSIANELRLKDTPTTAPALFAHMALA